MKVSNPLVSLHCHCGEHGDADEHFWLSSPRCAEWVMLCSCSWRKALAELGMAGMPERLDIEVKNGCVKYRYDGHTQPDTLAGGA